MYPFVRSFTELAFQYGKPRLGLTEPLVTRHMVLPWDLDPSVELNNGRTLTLYDLGRLPYFLRIGLFEALRREGWGVTVAGNTVRYRRRMVVFQRFTMVTRCLGWDARFFYLDQSMWRDGDCTNHMLVRSAVTSKAGIVAPARVLQALGAPTESPALPPWVEAWIAADAERPWPPESGRFLQA